MAVGTRQAGLCISEMVDILRFSHIVVSKVYTESVDSSAGMNDLLRKEVQGVQPDWIDLIRRKSHYDTI